MSKCQWLDENTCNCPDLFMQIDLTIEKYKTMAKNSNTSRKLWAMEVVEDLIRIREAMIKDLK